MIENADTVGLIESSSNEDEENPVVDANDDNNSPKDDLTREETLQFLDDQIEDFEDTYLIQRRIKDKSTSLDRRQDVENPQETANADAIQEVDESKEDLEYTQEAENEDIDVTEPVRSNDEGDTSDENRFDTNEETAMTLKQNHQPQKGDKILFFSKQRDSWQVISLTSNAIRRFLKFGWYYNFLYQDMEKDGTYLHPGKPYWGLLSSDEAAQIDPNNVIASLPVENKEEHTDDVLEHVVHIDENEGNIIDVNQAPTTDPVHSSITQVDGGVTPDSLSPLTSAKA